MNLPANNCGEAERLEHLSNWFAGSASWRTAFFLKKCVFHGQAVEQTALNGKMTLIWGLKKIKKRLSYDTTLTKLIIGEQVREIMCEGNVNESKNCKNAMRTACT
ncbi:hypothetical protein [Thalassoglobus sp.]|uniref:hypothetical protein n=1 Tax=Thalassoglobus sp. TaxID=2795869 RepID=UPI003AA98BA4